MMWRKEAGQDLKGSLEGKSTRHVKAESDLIPKLRLTDERRAVLLLERVRPSLKSHFVSRGTQQFTENNRSNAT